MPTSHPSRRPGLSAPLVAALGLLGALGCGRKAEAPPAAVAQEAAPAPAPWTWHGLGNLVVVEGEVPEACDLILEGRSIRHLRAAELGPVRWELLRPPQGEVATLKDGQGRLLATFTFKGDGQAPPEKPRLLAKAKPAPPPRPAPVLRPAPAPRPAAPAPAIPAPEPIRLAAAALPKVAARKGGGAPLALAPAQPRAPEPEAVRPAPPPGTVAAPTAGTWPGVGEALNLTHGDRSQRRILLSFDGGSNNEGAAEILDALRARGIRTTLFLTGTFIRKFPALVRRMAAEGHELGNHTTHHPHFAPNMKRDPQWTREKVQEELLSADRALVELLGRPMDPVWRAPYGEHTVEIRRWAEELGYRHVGWSEGADSLDWATPKERKLYRSGDAILQRLQVRLQKDGGGLIVLMHLGSERDEKDRPAAKLGAFLDQARAGGWTFVTAGELIKGMGKPTWDRNPRLALLQRGGSAGAR
ncbi:MAG TPA: polysaccharide deacetylase family protein [Holophagaceae bacterium]|nr:polysaccharide deacetylase family protein [Holophagaceae bacterium]